jgi:hypothetical protein
MSSFDKHEVAQSSAKRVGLASSTVALGDFLELWVGNTASIRRGTRSSWSGLWVSGSLHSPCSSVRNAALRNVHLIEIGLPSATCCRSWFQGDMRTWETLPLGELQGGQNPIFI